MKKTLFGWLGVGLAGALLLPWYRQEDGLFADGGPFAGLVASGDRAAALFQALWHGRAGLWPLLALLLIGAALSMSSLPRRQLGLALCGVGGGGLAWLIGQGWGTAQPALGYGAILVGLSFLFVLTSGAAALGACRGDRFVTGAIGLVVALVALFVFYPVARVLVGAFQGADGQLAWTTLWPRVLDHRIWGLNCLGGGGNCGVAWNTLLLALLTALGTTLLGLSFALVVTRSGLRWSRPLRALTVLPIITPPFVIGLALILLFGRTGVVTHAVSTWLGVAPGRWLYGLPGIWLAQMLSFTPIAFMVLIGVVEGIGPALEEASQTLGASRWQTFCRVSLPLIRPGLANAFLLCFIESMADFGNPMVLGGNFGVLSTEIFYAVVGAQNDPGRAAGLAIVLLTLAVAAFVLQRRWVGSRSYITVTGKGDSGQHAALDPQLARVLRAVVLPWTLFTLTVYGMILVGGFVDNVGRNNSFTLRHYADAFGVQFDPAGWQWYGAAWPSFRNSMLIAGVSAPLTAMLGLLAAWLLVRQRFAMKPLFEFGTMLSFAIPGTVIGISYILAFNVPPVELTGTAAILVLCFVFRNMPVGLRGGIAAMSQLDGSLDEASTMLRAGSFVTVRRVILPLMRPALAAALVYSFVRSITSISAVVFLVSADYNMATAYIVGLVENGRYGVAIAYSSVLIVVMLACILLAQRLVGRRQLRRQDRIQPVAAPVLKEITA